ncbi:hypothetical protein SARC_16487, partial [Sphaeroforma arctica JP610]
SRITIYQWGDSGIQPWKGRHTTQKNATASVSGRHDCTRKAKGTSRSDPIGKNICIRDSKGEVEVGVT